MPFPFCFYIYLFIVKKKKSSRRREEGTGDGANPLLHIDGDDDLTSSSLPGECLGSVFGKLSLEITCFSCWREKEEEEEKETVK